MERRVFEAYLKRMAINLSNARGSVKEVAAELAIVPGRLSKWRQKDGSPARPVQGRELSEEQQEIRRLQKELKQAQLERDAPDADATSDSLKKAVSIFSRGDGRYTGSYRSTGTNSPPEKMCRVLQVSTSGRRKSRRWWRRVRRSTGRANAAMAALGLISFELQEQGIHVSRPRVARIMQKHRTRSIVRRKYRVQTTGSSHTHAVAENYLSRDFAANRPAEKWVSDLTCIRTGEGWLYLTVVLDLADRKVVGWALSGTMEAEATTVAPGRWPSETGLCPAPFCFTPTGGAGCLQRLPGAAGGDAGTAEHEPQG